MVKTYSFTKLLLVLIFLTKVNSQDGDCTGDTCVCNQVEQCSNVQSKYVDCESKQSCQHATITITGDGALTCNGEQSCQEVSVTCQSTCHVDCTGKDGCQEGDFNCGSGDDCSYWCDDDNSCHGASWTGQWTMLSIEPTKSPTKSPTTTTFLPTASPTTTLPSQSPMTSKPSNSPTHTPSTSNPSLHPASSSPSRSPSRSPSKSPSKQPTNPAPTMTPITSHPSYSPSPNKTDSGLSNNDNKHSGRTALEILLLLGGIGLLAALFFYFYIGSEHQAKGSYYEPMQNKNSITINEEDAPRKVVPIRNASQSIN